MDFFASDSFFGVGMNAAGTRSCGKGFLVCQGNTSFGAGDVSFVSGTIPLVVRNGPLVGENSHFAGGDTSSFAGNTSFVFTSGNSSLVFTPGRSSLGGVGIDSRGLLPGFGLGLGSGEGVADRLARAIISSSEDVVMKLENDSFSALSRRSLLVKRVS